MNNTRTVVRGGFSMQVGLALIIFGVASATVARAEFPDRTGPRLLVAVIDDTAFGGLPFPTNTIHVLFSEEVNFASARDTNNFKLTGIGDTNCIPIVQAFYSTALGLLLTVDSTHPNWLAQGDYVLTVNRVRDTRGNVIAPDSQIAVSRRFQKELVPVHAGWSHHGGYNREPDIYDQPWEMPDYVESPWWIHGLGPFCVIWLSAVNQTETACLGPCQSLMVYGPQPALFRTSFTLPTNSGPNGYFSFITEADDAMIVYLNGREIWRRNLSRQITRLSADPGFDIVWEFPPLCVTNRSVVVTNMVPGINWLAVGVVQARVGNAVDAFALRVEGVGVITPPLPHSPPPSLNVARLDDGFPRFSWTGHGYALESATELTGNSASHPLGPWQEVPNMANPYTNSLAGPQRFFRLKK